MRYSHKKFLLGLPLAGFLILNAAPAFAGWDRGDHHDFGHGHYSSGWHTRSLPHNSVSIVFGGGHFYFGEGHFYRRYSRDYVVVDAPIGAVVYSLPGGCRPVIYSGVTYYTYDGIYYRRAPRGYEIVQQPPIVEDYEMAPSPVAAPVSTKPQDAFTINIPNTTGGYTAVTLKRSGNGFIGPQGEFYPEFPQVEQLRAMYAK
jgi:hypothetical protein